MSESRTLEFANQFTKQNGARYFLSNTGEPCAQVIEPVTGAIRTFYVNSSQFRDFVTAFFGSIRVHINNYYVKELSSAFRANAFSSKIKSDVFIRVAKNKESIFVDLCNQNYEVVKINTTNWEIIKNSDIPFIRLGKQMPLPVPVSVEKSVFLKKFKRLFNLKNPKQYLLLLAAVLKMLDRDNGAYPIMIFDGPQGAGKTTATNRIRDLIDPSRPSLVGLPNDEKDIVAMAKAAFLLCFDNLSGMKHIMSDFFCRLSSGGGTSKRILFTDNDEVSFELQSPVVFNGISEISDRSDFLDRSVKFNLAPLDFSQRKSELALKEEFIEDYPLLLGGIYTLLSECKGHLPNISTTGLNRMTELHRMGIALEKSLDLTPGEFSEAYTASINELQKDLFFEDEVCCRIYDRLMYLKARSPKDGPYRLKSDSKVIEGTALEILEELSKTEARGGRKVKLPATPQGFSKYVHRIEPLLNKQGIILTKDRNSERRTMRFSFADNEGEAGGGSSESDATDLL